MTELELELKSAELVRLEQEEARSDGANWKRWGPYLSDRQWGTVREDYSADGSPWTSFPHDHARGRDPYVPQKWARTDQPDQRGYDCGKRRQDLGIDATDAASKFPDP